MNTTEIDNVYNNLIDGSEELLFSVPVKIVKFARKLGLDVYSNNKLGPMISGIIKQDPIGQYRIYVNGNHPEVRQRFTIAHELAHFLMHRDRIGNGIVDDVMYRSEGMLDTQEREANRLAGMLLMPEQAVIEHYKKTPSSFELAKLFNVSHTAMEIRLKSII